jgi:hypothetical protein
MYVEKITQQSDFCTGAICWCNVMLQILSRKKVFLNKSDKPEKQGDQDCVIVKII